MEKVSAKTFFAVLWKGVCQALGWLLGQFGYKRDGKFAHCVWGLFATSAAIVMAIIAIGLLREVGGNVCQWASKSVMGCRDKDCGYWEYVAGDIYYHDHYDGKGYIYNKRTGKKLIKRVEWIHEAAGSDTLVCFSQGGKRGYFGKNSGRVIVKPKYDHAWVFSEGLACVDDGGTIKFIDTTGQEVINTKMAYSPEWSCYVFHGGYCITHSDDGEKQGLIDRDGRTLLPAEYDDIEGNDEYNLWRIQQGKKMAVLDSKMQPIVPLTECEIYIGGGSIDVTMPDHTIRKYDMQGQLMDHFYINSVSMLEYEKEEIVYVKDEERKERGESDEEYCDESDSEDYYHPKATARLRSYNSAGYEGLITADGHIVTMPLYKDISAIGPDLYLCETTNWDYVIVNGKGEVVRQEGRLSEE